VPLGAFLSGGIDSSTVVALMQARSVRPVKTFSIGFAEEGYNEAKYAKAVARHLGTDHSELYVTAQQAMEVIPRLPEIYDEPFADSSEIPTFLLARLARQQVTVSLSGDAGDELFGGYGRYLRTARMWKTLYQLPTQWRTALSHCMCGISTEMWNALASPLLAVGPMRYRHYNAGDRLHKLAEFVAADSIGALYLRSMSHWVHPGDVVIDGLEPPTAFRTAVSELKATHCIEAMMAMDQRSYLPDDILVKVDRAAMAVSLETRVPFLDHRVVEFAWRLPLVMKVRKGETKWILRQVLYKYVPTELVDRRKAGFTVPIGAWLRGPLRDWAEDLLDESQLRKEGYLRPEPIRKKWLEHVGGSRNWPYDLWNVLMFQAWMRASSSH